MSTCMCRLYWWRSQGLSTALEPPESKVEMMESAGDFGTNGHANGHKPSVNGSYGAEGMNGERV